MGGKPGKRCLVMGGCGFLGSHLVDHLLARGYEVKVFDRIKVNTDNIQPHLKKIELIRGDFANQEDFKVAVQNTDYIFHLIGTTLPQSATQNPIYDLESNVVSTIHLLEVARGAGVKKVIFASSGGTIYGIPRRNPIAEEHETNPICAYGISKLVIEKYLHLYYHLYGLPYVSLRIANAYGERQDPTGAQGVIAVFLGRILAGKPVQIWGDGKVVRDYVHARDVAAAFLRAMEMEQKEARIFNIGSGRGISLNELLDLLKRNLGMDFPVQYSEARRIDVPVNVLDISLARKGLHWEPQISIGTGVRQVFDFMRVPNQNKSKGTDERKYGIFTEQN